ncbi:Gfo/Idh/MocA family oxidoreductase [Kineosporia mesophila]|uniref:Gfo/Idh/MocA family oxidoreductase n=1 Tax=Kineosporia mesophila TaxID=566012 RepID=A0ABP6Z1P1_9ACTN|nr:Gfo/Idh/MocA family oxidoreductase [Kineosporia mesophila]MCD5350979.1 Gfo/Idh/MocA family oxidoreductase [Kineosporia mesophila]
MTTDVGTDDLAVAVDGRDRPIGLAVIGAGYWGPNLARNAHQSDALRLMAVVDRDPAAARKLAYRYAGVIASADLEGVLADPGIDAVAVATPAASHHAVASAAIAAGKHVLVEKPLAATYAEGLSLVEAAERRGVVLMCDHTYCYTPVVQRIREITHAGELGDIQFVDSVRINLGLVQPDVDVLWDLAPHDLAILDHVLPQRLRPLAVSAQAADPIGAGQACVGYLTLHLPGGAIAHAHVNWLSPVKVRTTLIGGSRRTLVWDDLNPSQRLSVYDRGVDLTDTTDTTGSADADDRHRRQVSYRSGDMTAPALPEREALQGVMTEFSECIRTGRAPVTDGRSGLRLLDILEAATASLNTGGTAVSLREGGR